MTKDNSVIPMASVGGFAGFIAVNDNNQDIRKAA